MREEYDFSTMKQVPNPYAKKEKQQITIRLNTDAIEYFKQQAASIGISYQNLINLYLADCASKSKTLNISWK
ncbi:MAG: BrnA antitoxin family protein [Clostridiales Family XIII bacterium]|jgi:predicted DNA binding CopG/RHH family protein|nr:BrnA antitoxin family protein [Clostridiales Family XIII bacterium]